MGSGRTGGAGARGTVPCGMRAGSLRSFYWLKKNETPHFSIGDPWGKLPVSDTVLHGFHERDVADIFNMAF